MPPSVVEAADVAPRTAPSHSGANTVYRNPKHWATLLLAGDGGVPAFDHAINHLADLLEKSGIQPVKTLSAAASRDSGAGLASLIDLEQGLAHLNPAPDGGCLVYLVSHGTPDQGLYLPVSDRTLTPQALDRALDQGCAAAPTVVIVSACYAGLFTEPPMRRPNRIIITAARADRASFGCSANAAYTTFDACFLGALAGADDWVTAIERTLFCVGAREALSHLVPSEPQIFIGSAVTELAAPLSTLAVSARTTAQGDGLFFTPNSLPFNPKLIETALDLPRPIALTLQRPLRLYQVAKGVKSLAGTPEGFIVAVTEDSLGTPTGLTLKDTARLALQRCEYLSGGACYLMAIGDRMSGLLPHGAIPFHPQILRLKGPVRAEDTPFILIKDQDAIRTYLAQPRPKALALRLNRPGLAIARDPAEALAQCQADGSPCRLYARDDEIVENAPP